ncbi:MAG: hypothetical protein ABI566_04550 [Pseudolysinimonas sp.]
MSESVRTIWIGGEPVAVPEHARVVHVEGERLAVVAVPSWRAVVLTPGGSIEAPDAATNDGMLREYFPDLAPESSKILNAEH